MTHQPSARARIHAAAWLLAAAFVWAGPNGLSGIGPSGIGPSEAGAITWDVAEPFDLQAVVDSAAYGDTVWVAPGEYDRVILRSGIRLIAVEGPEVTILRSGDLWCVKADGVDSTAVLEGFTLDGAQAAEGVVTADNSYFTVRDCVVRGAWSGIRAMYSDLRIENCTIRDCQNGIYLFESGGRVRNNEIRDCINGVNLVSASPRVSGNTIRANSVGIFLSEHSDPRVGGSLATANRIHGNRSGNVLNRALEKRFSVRTMKPMTLKASYNFWGSDCPDSLWFRGPVVWTPWVDEAGSRSLDECPTDSVE